MLCALAIPTYALPPSQTVTVIGMNHDTPANTHILESVKPLLKNILQTCSPADTIVIGLEGGDPSGLIDSFHEDSPYMLLHNWIADNIGNCHEVHFEGIDNQIPLINESLQIMHDLLKTEALMKSKNCETKEGVDCQKLKDQYCIIQQDAAINLQKRTGVFSKRVC